MTRISKHLFRTGITALALTSALALAQDQPPVQPQSTAAANGGWRRVGDQPPATPQANAPTTTAPADGAEPVDRTGDAPAQQPPMMAPQATTSQATTSQATTPQATPQTARPYGIPPQLTMKPGTFFTVRTNTMLASNKNKQGDLFTATLAQPLVVDGIVIAQRGQTVVGRVADSGKGKDGVHFLKLELTGITLADGTQVPVQSQLATTQGRTTPAGVQAGTVVGTTAVGAAIGGAAAWGTGAAIGAGAGAIAGIAGVIATRDHPAVLYPETPLTFQITSPVTVSTVNAPQAYRYVGPEDYAQQPAMSSRLNTRPPGPGAYPPANYLYGPGYAYPGYYPGYYPYAGYYPYYYGPSFGIGIGFGPGFYGRRWR